LSKVAGGVTLSAGEQQIYDTYRNGRRGRGSGGTAATGGSGSPEGTVAVNPTTGQRQIKRNGKWVPLS